MDYIDYIDMGQYNEENCTQCAVHDKTPGSDQKKIVIVVRPKYTVEKVIQDITTQFRYDLFDLILQPISERDDLIYLNKCREQRLYHVPGFEPVVKNTLILLPYGKFDGNVKRRFDLTTSAPLPPSHLLMKCDGLGPMMAADTADLVLPSLPMVTSTTNPVDSLKLSPMTPDQMSDDDLALGASASPTETDVRNVGSMMITRVPSPSSQSAQIGPMAEDSYNLSLDTFYCSKFDKKVSRALTPGYVGLVNQAMTCYLNSLLQALYMTPEFRNALYRWEFDNDNEAKNIPYQLQKLFLNLQTSEKSAVETTDLTRSFGWDSTEAWQQHDIQELCRVMFDALEHKFKNTKQANLISNLYEGKMIDYVKCLECNTEKTRADTFLDIPLPVRPFGSTVAYGSIEEALRAFVQPETLDGNNQYFCEKCNKKCDAHKGLKFKNFPYILTLHLKRFDFDYQTMYRIKLNDKVTFPQVLNLNTFINTTDTQTFSGSHSNGITASAAASYINGTTGADDCSITDSGSTMEEDNCSSGIATTASSSQHENDMQEDDEGIDLSTSTDNRTTGSTTSSSKNDTGAYQYELFAIMIHSGSASGGHYYAYIKEFEHNEWFCFNDQTVTPITQEDIQKSFGGGSTKSYYSSVYSSSTNAYMLMYRQIDPKRNEHATKADAFPPHINALLRKLSNENETRRSRRTSSDKAVTDLLKPRVYFYNPQLKKMKVTRVYMSRSSVINSVLESAYQMLSVDQFAPISRCRVVLYDQSSEEIIKSFEHVNDHSLESICASSSEALIDFLLEYRTEGNEFEVYEPGGVTWQAYKVDLQSMEMDGPFLVYSHSVENSEALKRSVAIRLGLNPNEILLATLPSQKLLVAGDSSPSQEAQDNLQNVALKHFTNLMYFYLSVPNTDPDTLEILGIPQFDTVSAPPLPVIEVGADVVDAVRLNSHPLNNGDVIIGNHLNSHETDFRRESPLPPTGHESNSEDSSLSDGDRTLVESIHNTASGGCGGAASGGGDSQISSTSHSPQLSSPEEESNESINRIHSFFNGSAHMSTNGSSGDDATSQYFFATKIIGAVDTPSTAALSAASAAATSVSATNLHSDSDDANKKPPILYKIIADSNMKVRVFKRHIESLIRVPANYFKFTRKHDSSEGILLFQTLRFLNENETVLVELGKVLQGDEHKAKIYFMKLSELNNDSSKLPCICEWIYKTGTSVAEAKRTLISKLHRIDEMKYRTLNVNNCRVWMKAGRNPVKILNEEECLEKDVPLVVSSDEFLIQECEDGINPQPSDESLTLFVRRWHPDTLELDKFQEITLEKNSDIKQILASISNIPEEDIAYTKIESSFPCTNISLLNINGRMNWITTPTTLDKYPLKTTINGNVFFYKDTTKSSKELTNEERREFTAKEKIRLDRLGCISTSLYSPRRERALKIYLDSPQTTSNTANVGGSVVGLDYGGNRRDQ